MFTDYTEPKPEIVAEAFAKGTPTKGQQDFAAVVANEFKLYREETDSFDATIARDDQGVWLDAIVDDYDAAAILKTYRDVTNVSTEDIDHACAVLWSAAAQAWGLLADDYQTYLTELYEERDQLFDIEPDEN